MKPVHLFIKGILLLSGDTWRFRGVVFSWSVWTAALAFLGDPLGGSGNRDGLGRRVGAKINGIPVQGASHINVFNQTDLTENDFFVEGCRCS